MFCLNPEAFVENHPFSPDLEDQDSNIFGNGKRTRHKKKLNTQKSLDTSLASPRFPKEPGLLPRSAPTLLVSWTISEGIVRPRANPGILVKELDMARILSVYSRTPKKVKR